MKYSAKTDIGNIKENNEDAFLTLVDNLSCKVFAVADGMGGHDFGEEASEIAVLYIKNHYDYNRNLKDYKKYINEIFSKINEKIYQTGLNKNSTSGMGTTLTLVIIFENKLYIGHIGDSRLYIINKEITQLTKDHSYVEELVDKGMITKREAKNHPKKNIITRALGTFLKIEVDIFDYELKENDIVLLCSDGLTNMVDDNEIKKIVLDTENLENANEQLVKLANLRGGYDNITIVTIKEN